MNQAKKEVEKIMSQKLKSTKPNIDLFKTNSFFKKRGNPDSLGLPYTFKGKSSF